MASLPRPSTAAVPAAVRLNDVHSRLNPTRVARVLRPRDEAELRRAVSRQRALREPLAVMGARHAMGGQQFLTAGTVLDTAALDRIGPFDPARGLVVVEAGARWPALLAWLRAHPDNGDGWTIRQKQTGGDDFSIGGAVAANIHGRGLRLAPFVDDLEWIELVCADGRLVRASRSEAPALFALAVGGYGLFGVVVRACLRLARGATLQRRVALVRAGEAMAGFEAAIGDGCTYGDFQFAIDPAGADFLDAGIQSCYRPVPGPPDPAPARMDEAGFRRLLVLAHADPARAFEEYAAFYRRTHGQRYAPDEQHGGLYLDGYHGAVDRAGHPGSEMIGELYVPRLGLAGFLAEAADLLRGHRAQAIYGTVRLVERDPHTLLAWARAPWACVVLNLHVHHDATGLRRAVAAFRGLIDLALARAGSFYLTYHRWARADQLEAAYPAMGEFLRAKRELDPDGLFQSDWYRHLAALLGARP